MYAILILVIVASAQFILLFIMRMRVEMMKGTVEKHSLCFRILSCCCVKDTKAFKDKHSVGKIGADEISIRTLNQRVGKYGEILSDFEQESSS